MAFLVLSAVTGWRGHENVMAVTLALGGALVLAALLIPGHLGPVYRGWMKFGLALSKVTTPIFMSVVFFGVLTPTAFLKKLFGGSRLSPQRTAPTFWHDRSPDTRRGDLKHQF